MAEVIYGERPMRYEAQWLGRSGNWWTIRHYRRRWAAILSAFTWPGRARVLDHGDAEVSRDSRG